MKTYSNVYKSQKFRKLFSAAIALKESYDMKETFEVIEKQFDKYLELFQWLNENLPLNFFKGSQLLRHSKALHFYLKKKQKPEKCYKDIRDICYQDLIEVFQKWIIFKTQQA